MKTFIRGIVLTCPSIVVGVLIVRYVPANVVSASVFGLLLFVIYLAGALLKWPWEKRRGQTWPR